jgi:hypothetical protein
VEHLEKALTNTEEILSKYVNEAESARTEMDDLKAILYLKFGSSINLEDK